MKKNKKTTTKRSTIANAEAILAALDGQIIKMTLANRIHKAVLQKTGKAMSKEEMGDAIDYLMKKGHIKTYVTWLPHDITKWRVSFFFCAKEE